MVRLHASASSNASFFAIPNDDMDIEADTPNIDLLEDLALPALNICILVVGTHGDVLPFCGLGAKLQALGHRVRIATHKVHRLTVVSRGFEFYPLAGDPKQLSQWVVKSGGTLAGEFKNPKALPEKSAIVSEIIRSCLPAVTKPDPDDELTRPFEANAVISNPASYAHIHVCEALSIPLHIMFPQPWYYGTKDYPHPMMGLSFKKTDTIIDSQMNVESYSAWEVIQWSAFARAIASVRKQAGLPPVMIGSGCSQAIVRSNIPYSAMWSPSFVPTPHDWPKHCRVVGSFTEKKGAVTSFDETPFKDLLEWIDAGKKPLFMGFGSMIIKDTEKLANIIINAARATETRIIVQSGWCKIDVSEEPTFCASVGPCPHDWLLPKTGGVIHHGGAGTTAAGIRYGLPTLVCPLQGDQFMWGEMIHRAGAGPEPCPVSELTKEILSEKFIYLKDAKVLETVQTMSKLMDEEDGIEGGLSHYLEYFPRQSLYCDVGLLMGETNLATHKLRSGNVKMSIETTACLQRIQKSSIPSEERQWSIFLKEPIEKNEVTNYAVGHVTNAYEGFRKGILSFFFLIISSPLQFFFSPDKVARSHGAFGCLFGLFISPFYVVWKVLQATIYSFDCILTGWHNSLRLNRDEHILHTIEFLSGENNFFEKNIEGSLNTILQLKSSETQSFSKARQDRILRALKIACKADSVFKSCRLYYPKKKLSLQGC